MKTAMQEVLDELRKSSKITSNHEYKLGLEYACACIAAKIGLQKQQLKSAYSTLGSEEDSEEWFNQTYKQ